MTGRRHMVEPQPGAPMQDMIVRMDVDDALLIGGVRVELTQTARGKAYVRVDAPHTPVVLLSRGRVKVGAHHKLVEIDDGD